MLHPDPNFQEQKNNKESEKERKNKKRSEKERNHTFFHSSPSQNSLHFPSRVAMNATERVGAKKRKPPSEESLANEYERKRARYQTEKDDHEKVAKKVAQRKDYYQKNKEKIKSRYQNKKGSRSLG